MLSPEYITDFSPFLADVKSLKSADDPVTKALAHKAILQANVLGIEEDESVFAHNIPLQLGVFTVFPTVAEIDWASPSNKFNIKAGQTYLDYHVPGRGSLTNDIANRDYREVASFIDSRKEVHSIVGVTYQTMARSAERNQDFSTEQIELPKEVMDFASAVWQDMAPRVKPEHFQTAHLVWHYRDSFLKRFLD